MFSHIDAILENLQSSFHLNAFQGRIETVCFLGQLKLVTSYTLSNKCKNQVAAPKMVRQETANALKLFLSFQVSQNHAPLTIKNSETKSTFHMATVTLHSTEGKKQHATRSAV
jgi:hypothetical protein